MVRDPYARWCDRESSRGPTYVNQQVIGLPPERVIGFTGMRIWPEFVCLLIRLNPQEQRFLDCLALSAAPCNCTHRAAAFASAMRNIRRMSQTRDAILREARRIVNAC